MIDQLARLDEEHLLFLALMAGLALLFCTAIACMVIVQIRMFRQRQLELGFRDEMLRRGLTVAEVTQVLTGAPPVRSHSITSMGGWLTSRVSRKVNALAAKTGPGWERGRSRLRDALNHSSRVISRCWRQTVSGSQSLWHQARPLFIRAKHTLGRCMTWAGNWIDDLTRRLAPPA